MAQGNTSHWEAPKFSFNTEDQAAAWRNFYTRALDYLETLDIDPERVKITTKGMETGKDDVHRGR